MDFKIRMFLPYFEKNVYYIWETFVCLFSIIIRLTIFLRMLFPNKQHNTWQSELRTWFLKRSLQIKAGGIQSLLTE